MAIDKHALYAAAVQQPDADVRFFRELCRELKGRGPKILREDFCGSFGVCCEWAKLGPGFRAYGRDLGREPLAWGRKHLLTKLTPEQRARVTVERKDVCAPGGPKADLIMAMNFSYFIFKERKALKGYFDACRRNLRRGGVLALDVFGGGGTHRPNKERTDHPRFSYWWEQYGFDPVFNTARCAMHFKPKGGTLLRDAFTYDWRLWSIAELRDLLAEAGFRKSHVYWESEGGGRYARDPDGGREDIWIAALLAEL